MGFFGNFLNGIGLGAPSASPITSGFAQSQRYITQGSGQAKDLLRQAYENAFAARVAGAAGAIGGSQRAYGAQVAGQGLSPDVAQRMLAERRAGYMQDLEGARGELSSNLGQNLAELQKGTGTELAGLNRDMTAALANYRASVYGSQLGLLGGIIGAAGKIAAPGVT
jgi:hypothetical protein